MYTSPLDSSFAGSSTLPSMLYLDLNEHFGLMLTYIFISDSALASNRLKAEHEFFSTNDVNRVSICQYVNMSVRQYVLKLTLLNCQGPYADHDSDGN